MNYLREMKLSSYIVAQLDCLQSFAFVSLQKNYCKPTINDSRDLYIEDGRHPIVEDSLPPGESFTANDTNFNTDEEIVHIITGPNMSGKSSYLRQTAIIVLMAQVGCYVPAKKCTLGLVDKIYTRVGAGDNIRSGESTFLVEMQESANIMNNATDKSLILLDEVGRGTATFDGISIAWAIAEHIHNKLSAKTLFATHYHELNDMSSTFGRIKNYNVSVKEIDNKIIFLRKLVAGGSNHSFGIHVAKMAGMPAAVVNRAKQILKHLEKSHKSEDLGDRTKTISNEEEMQLSFFKLDDPVLEQVREQILQTDIDTLTPVEALMKLNEIKRMVSGKK
jgi:DNA mismatch repair protein MutS